MKSLFKSVLFAGSVLGFAGCHPEPDNLQLVDQLVVYTSFDPNPDAAITNYTSYAIATDTIGYFTNVNPNDTIRVYDTDFVYPRLVLEEVEDNLPSALVRKEVDESPDLGINVYVVNGVNLYQQVVYPTYGGYYYGYSNYYYYPYIETYITNRATLFIEIVDIKNRDANGGVKVIWSAQMGDVINSIDYEQQSVDAIREAFETSPYFK